jgi:hypothetical protein
VNPLVGVGELVNVVFEVGDDGGHADRGADIVDDPFCLAVNGDGKGVRGVVGYTGAVFRSHGIEIPVDEALGELADFRGIDRGGMFSGGSDEGISVKDDALGADSDRVGGTSAVADGSPESDGDFGIWTEDGCGIVRGWKALRRDKIYVLVNFGGDCFAIDFKGGELPGVDFGLKFWPKLELFWFRTGDGFDHFADGRDGEREANLIGAGGDALEWDRSAMGLDFMLVGDLR